jgi:type I restriction enzyme S subunit
MKRIFVYPQYEDSGISWLGLMPTHWDITPAKRIFKQKKGKSHPGDPQLAVTQNHGVVRQDEYMEESGNRVVQALKGTENFKHVNYGDFVISLRSFEGGIELSKNTGCVSPAYIVIEPKKDIYNSSDLCPNAPGSIRNSMK